MAILYYSGGHMNLVMTMLPPLVFVLSVSAAVHLVNYYRDALEEDRAPGGALSGFATWLAPVRAGFGHDGHRPAVAGRQ